MKLVIPMRTQAGANSRFHWAKKARIVKGQRTIVAYHWLASEYRERYLTRAHFENGGGLTVTLTRVSPQLADSDNLQSNLKSCRDEVAMQIPLPLVNAKLRLADDRHERVRWVYKQRRGATGEHAVEIEVERR